MATGWSIDPTTGVTATVEDNGYKLVFDNRDNLGAQTYTIRYEDASGNCGETTITQKGGSTPPPGENKIALIVKNNSNTNLYTNGWIKLYICNQGSHVNGFLKLNSVTGIGSPTDDYHVSNNSMILPKSSTSTFNDVIVSGDIVTYNLFGNVFEKFSTYNQPIVSTGENITITFYTAAKMYVNDTFTANSSYDAEPHEGGKLTSGSISLSKGGTYTIEIDDIQYEDACNTSDKGDVTCWKAYKNGGVPN